MKKNNFIYLFYGIFGLVGIGLLIGGISWLVNGITFKQNAVEVTAQIVEIETYRDSDGDVNHRVYIDYTFNGDTYSYMPLNSYSSDMYIGKEITVLCNPDQPGRTMTATGIFLAGGILIGMGLIFASVGIVPMVVSLCKGGRQKELLTNGQVLYATVDDIVWNTSFSVNGQHPFVIYCSYKDDYRDITYRFKSNNLWTDPSAVFPIGSEINVYVNPNDYSKYYVNAEESVSKRIVDYT